MQFVETQFAHKFTTVLQKDVQSRFNYENNEQDLLLVWTFSAIMIKSEIGTFTLTRLLGRKLQRCLKHTLLPALFSLKLSSIFVGIWKQYKRQVSVFSAIAVLLTFTNCIIVWVKKLSIIACLLYVWEKKPVCVNKLYFLLKTKWQQK